jgi:hypothetical protein
MPGHLLTPLGELLERARTDVLHISVREAARRTGSLITEARWRQVVKGTNGKPRAVNVVAMALAVGVDPADALTAADITATPESVAALIEEARNRPRMTVIEGGGGDALADEIERIRGLPISAKARIRMMQALVDVYEEVAHAEKDDGPTNGEGSPPSTGRRGA